jgi:hypothetical protein
MYIEHRTSNVDMAAKRRKKHKNKISEIVISIFQTFYESINVEPRIMMSLRFVN